MRQQGAIPFLCPLRTCQIIHKELVPFSWAMVDPNISTVDSGVQVSAAGSIRLSLQPYWSSKAVHY